MLLLQPALVRRFAAAGSAIFVLLTPGLLAAAGEPPRLPAARPPGGEVAPPVQDLVARALANAPSIAARRERMVAAQAAAKAADVLPDPMLEFEVKDAGFPKWTLGEDQMSMIGATIRQPLVSKGRKATRLAAATAEIDVRRAETAAAACDLTVAVRTVYGRLYAVDRERAILRDSEEMARLLVETATARYAAGSSDQTVVLRAQLERTRLSERVVDLDADRATLVVAMNRLLNEPPETPLGEVRELPEFGALAGTPATQAAAASLAPDVSLRKAEVAAATQRVGVRREEFGPNWSVGGSIFWQGGTARVVSFTVGVDWPWRKDRNQGPLLAASESELRAARLDLEDAAAGTRSEAARLAVEIKRAEDQNRPVSLRPPAAVVSGARRGAHELSRGARRLPLRARRVPPLDRDPCRTRASRGQPVRCARPARRAGQPRRSWRLGPRGHQVADTIEGATTMTRSLRSRHMRGSRYRAFTLVAAAFVAVTIGIAAGGCGAIGGGGRPSQKVASPAPMYHCPMHPEVVSDKPGDCPICGMRLVPIPALEKGAGGTPAAAAPAGGAPRAGDIGPASMDIGTDRARLAGVRTVEAKVGRVSRSIRATGTVVVDETRVRQVTTKVAGFVERLYVNTIGQSVRAGEPLFELYSAELLAGQEEYLRARRSAAEFQKSALPEVRQGGADLAAAARQRLERLDVPAGFLEALDESGTAQRTITFAAPFAGLVTGKSVVAGQRIEPGMDLLTVTDLSQVWVIAQVFEGEVRVAQTGRAARVTLPYDPDVSLSGRIAFVYPTVEPESRTLRVRLEFPNPREALKPGMFVTVELGAESESGIVIPDSAVLDTGTRQLVFVEAPPGQFAAREVSVRLRADGQAVVRSGLAAGDRVASSANFLLDSESRLRNAVRASVQKHQDH